MFRIPSTYPNSSETHRELDKKLRYARATTTESREIAQFIESLRFQLIQQDFDGNPEDVTAEILAQADTYPLIPTRKAFLDVVVDFLESERDIIEILTGRIGRPLAAKAKTLEIPKHLIHADDFLHHLYLELKGKDLTQSQVENLVNKMNGYAGVLNAFQGTNIADPIACKEEVEKITQRFPDDLRMLYVEKQIQFNLKIANDTPDQEEQLIAINEELTKINTSTPTSDERNKNNKEVTTIRKQILFIYYLNRVDLFPAKKKPISKSDYTSFLKNLLNRNEDNIRKKYDEFFDWPKNERTLADLKHSNRKGKDFYKDLLEVQSQFEAIGYGKCVEEIQEDINRYLLFLKP